MTSDTTRSQTAALDGRAPQAQRAALVVAWHPRAPLMGARWVLPEDLDLVVGRGATCAVPGLFDDTSVSRRHVRLRGGGATLDVEDLDSRNGTWVNGDRVDGRRTLRDGDVLRIGESVFVLRHPSAPAPAHADTRLVGCSAAIAEVVHQVTLAGPRDSAVLIVGETGTGKELVAQALHARSGRRGRLVPVNCGALGSGTFMSELFGHQRGAFTGADRASRGLVGEADGGTLLLDEIGDAPPALQVALLRFLQEGEVRPVGSTRPVQVDVRVVAATHRDLAQGPAPDGFRLDLLERLRRWVVQVPPLRSRCEDVPMLAEHLSHRYGAGVRLTVALAERLCVAPWPGNVRQLDGVVEQLVATSAGGPLSVPPWLESRLAPAHAANASVSENAPVARPPTPTCPPPDVLRALLQDEGGNVRALGRRLGVSRRTVYRWLDRAGITPDEGRQDG